MKHVPILIAAVLLGCGTSNNDGNPEQSDTGRIIEHDASTAGDDEGSYETTSPGDEYACAKVYLQIPHDYRDPETGDTFVMLSHQLWSVPVKKSLLNDDNKWHAVATEFNRAVPNASNVDLGNNEEAYAILIMENGTMLYDQVVIPTSNDTWQVCETLYCGQAGCQNHEGFESEAWQCHITQNRINTIGKCPCRFNNAGYPYCDIHYAQKEN